MKLKHYYILFSLFLSCNTVPENLENLNLSPQEQQLIGEWHEVGPKIANYDSNGNLIDSLDINAVFVFNNDYTYESQNEIYTGSTKGTWSFDSSFSKIFIVPVPMDIVLQSEHEWHIVTFDNEVLNVDHTYKLTLPDESYYIRHDVI